MKKASPSRLRGGDTVKLLMPDARHNHLPASRMAAHGPGQPGHRLPIAAGIKLVEDNDAPGPIDALHESIPFKKSHEDLGRDLRAGQ